MGFEGVLGLELRIWWRRGCDNLWDSGVVHGSRGSLKVTRRVATDCDAE